MWLKGFQGSMLVRCQAVSTTSSRPWIREALALIIWSISSLVVRFAVSGPMGVLGGQQALEPRRRFTQCISAADLRSACRIR